MANSSSDHNSAPNFELYGKMYDFNDGHTPETFPKDSKCKIVLYNDDRTTTNDINQSTIQMYENVLPDNLCKKIYNITCKMGEPWGTYVTKENALNTRNIDTNYDDDNSIDINVIAKQAVGYFLNGNHSQANLLHGSKPLCPFNDERVHGVQVWALSSHIGSSVAVHIDYAEYIRYCYNVIVPPLYAGTVQCTPNAIEGGEFAVNTNGLKCYEEHGYKGSFMGSRMGNWKTPIHNQSISSGPSLDENGWMTIPYKYNQGILHSGNLTHLSSPVKLIEGTDAKRVIVGFNVFAKDVGCFVEKVPEHSVQFRRLVRLNRSIKTNNSEGFSYNSIKTNKPLMKMLVLAKRHKVDSERRHLQRVVEEWLIQHFNDEQQFTVEDVLQKWKSDVLSSTLHPDIEMTINLLVRSKKSLSLAGTDFRLVCENDSDSYIENGLLNVIAALRFVSVHDTSLEPQRT